MKNVLRTTLVLAGLAAVLCTAACNRGGSDKSGPAVATVGGEKITADEFKKRLDETSPFLRARYNTVERKKEFLENLIRNELLAQEAQKRGLDKAPAVREQVKRAMIQELLKQQLDERLTGADIADDELRKFYDQHVDDFVRPERARGFRILLDAPTAAAKTAAKKKAQDLLKQIEDREKKGDTNAFQNVAMKESQDKLTAPLGGDMRFLTKDEVAKTYSPALADALFGLKGQGDKFGPVESPQGVELVKLQVKTASVDRKFDESKDSIRGRMARERRSKEYDEFVKKLRDGANVSVNDAELEKVSASEGAPAGVPQLPGMPPQPGQLPVQPVRQPIPAPQAPAPQSPAPQSH
jgi:peptidyl-prolyl cis-trans isomerase C